MHMNYILPALCFWCWFKEARVMGILAFCFPQMWSLLLCLPDPVAVLSFLLTIIIIIKKEIFRMPQNMPNENHGPKDWILQVVENSLFGLSQEAATLGDPLLQESAQKGKWIPWCPAYPTATACPRLIANNSSLEVPSVLGVLPLPLYHSLPEGAANTSG